MYKPMIRANDKLAHVIDSTVNINDMDYKCGTVRSYTGWETLTLPQDYKSYDFFLAILDADGDQRNYLFLTDDILKHVVNSTVPGKDPYVSILPNEGLQQLIKCNKTCTSLKDMMKKIVDKKIAAKKKMESKQIAGFSFN